MPNPQRSIPLLPMNRLFMPPDSSFFSAKMAGVPWYQWSLTAGRVLVAAKSSVVFIDLGVFKGCGSGPLPLTFVGYLRSSAQNGMSRI